MTNHPIAPPPELVRAWNQEATGTHFEPYGYSEFIATRAAQWGADTELEACCEWIAAHPWLDHLELLIKQLRAARRPKPSSLKERLKVALWNEDLGTALRLVEQIDD